MNELPKMWCIRFGEYNQFLKLKKHFVKFKPSFKDYTHTATYRAWSNDFEYNDVYILIKKGYTEISFKTFEKLVLGINKETIYELW